MLDVLQAHWGALNGTQHSVLVYVMPIWLIVLLGGVLGGALFYWLVVVAEGAYFGPWAVRLIYRYGAPHYDAIRAGATQRDPDELLPVLLAASAHTAHPQVLDVATGTGRVPLLLAATPTFTGTITALDLTVQMLAEAQAKQRASYPNAAIHWQQGDARQLRWPNASFDLVTCLEALEYMARPRHTLAEMVRVLRPGGNLVISKVPDNWAYSLPWRAFTAAALRTELTRLGMEAVQIQPWQPGHYELVIAHKPLPNLSTHG
jgi:ubiquinone/menaquinone biosynthesis C-methylase UbiE